MQYKTHMNNKLYLLFFTLYIILAVTIAKAEVITTYSLGSSTIDKVNKWIDHDTVIFIELDDVLVTPKAKMFAFNSSYRTFISDLVNLGKRYPLYDEVVAKWYNQRKVKLVELEWVDFIQSARAKGAKIYGICSMPLRLRNIEALRLKELQELGIIFNNELNNSNKFIIEDKFFWRAHFEQGIVYTGIYTKNEIIVELFKKAHLAPKKLIIFSYKDSKNKILDRAFRPFNMGYKTILYLAYNNSRDQPERSVAIFQQAQLIEYGKWYEDEEAKKLLEQKN